MGVGGGYLDPMCSLCRGTVWALWGLFSKSDFQLSKMVLPSFPPPTTFFLKHISDS